jgi:hypothetical protein
MFFDRITRSYALAKSSWNVLWTDKKLLVFPVLSGICCLLVLATFAIPFAIKPELVNLMWGKEGVNPPWWAYPLAFAYYFCNYFVIVFCNSALVSCALIRFNGGEPTLGDGLRAAWNRLPQIAAWAAVAATVGMILKALERRGTIGEIVSSLLGMAWSIVTFFVVPVLVVEKLGPIAAVKRSTAILRKTWGEALIGNWGIGAFMFLLFLPVIVFAFVIAVAFAANPILGIAALAMTGVYVLVLMAVSSAMHGIYITALYQYASCGRVPIGFDQQTLAGAFSPKTKKSGWF